MEKSNKERLQIVDDGLHIYNEMIMYVGGAMVDSYATDSTAVESRVTKDVDCVVNTNTYASHVKFEGKLEAIHFQHDISPDAPMCRWVYRGEKVDVMPIVDVGFQSVNRWYLPAFALREPLTLLSGKVIYRMPVVYFIASKIEALNSRGGSDWRGAKDFEDIVYVLNFCQEFAEYVRESCLDVRSFLITHFYLMLKRSNIEEEIESTIDDVNRVDRVLEVMQTIAAYKSSARLFNLQYVSDLHLEFPENRAWLKEHPLQVTGDVLLIAGDTAYLDVPDTEQDTYSAYEFWDWASQNYKQVIVCLGNHDFYDSYDLATMPDGYCKEIRHNVHAYYNKVVLIDNIDIIVSTLWSFIEPLNAGQTEQGVNDFRCILYNGHRFTADDFNEEHKRCLGFINKAIKESTAQTKIVLTHHVPTQLCTPKDLRNRAINGAFVVDLGNFIADSDIDYWVYGHSHCNIDAQHGTTRIVTNQFGYCSKGEPLNNGFDAGRFISVE